MTPLQFGNTGSQQNIQGTQQYASFGGEQDFTGPSFTIAPSLSGGCNQAVQQSSAASSN